MAVRENQGLQIALIIFVVLTIALVVSTYMFFSKWDEERSKIADYESKIQSARQEVGDQKAAIDDLKKILGVATTDSIKAITETQKADFAALNPGMADDKANYRALARDLKDSLQKAQADLIAAQDREQKLIDKIKVDETTKVAEIGTYKQNVDTTADNYKSERDKLMAQVNQAAAAKTDAEKKFAEQRKALDASAQKLKAEIEQLKLQLVRAEQVITRFRDERLQEDEAIEVADGRVRWVNQAQQLVWLDRGSADGLRQQVSFKVIDRDEPNPATAPTKATIEVIRVTDAHTAEARIVTDDPANPVLPGDVLFSTAWQPGRIERFALVGFMDIDGDKVSDRDLVRQLILNSGGLIDAELSDKGDLTGEMTPTTKYLVIGERPTDKDLSEQMQKNYTRFIDTASRLGIKVMPVATFLDYMGYAPQTKTVALDRNARADDFKPRAPEVQRRSIGKTIDFTPLRPKPKATTY